MKRLIALILLSVLILTGCSEDNEASQDPQEEMEEAFKQLDDFFDNIKKNEEEKEQRARDSAEINKVIVEEYDDEKMEYTLKGYRYQDEFSYTKTGYQTVEYTTSGKFLILEFNVDNIGKVESFVGKDRFVVLDKEDREYSALVGLEENIDDDTRKIGPGFDITFYSIYEVPSSFELAGLKVWESEYGNKYGIVDKSELGEVQKVFQ